MNRSESIAHLAPALAAAQGEFLAAVKRDTSDYGHKYASLAEVIRATRPALAKHGLAVLQPLGGDDTTMTITTILMHSSQESIEDTLTFHPPANGGEVDPQSVGRLCSYYRRYGYCSMLGIAMEDSDGITGEAVPPVAQAEPPAKPEPKPSRPKAVPPAAPAPEPQTEVAPPEPEPEPEPEPPAADPETRRSDVCSVIADLVRQLHPGRDANASRLKAELLERVFGSRMWTLVQRMPMDRLEAGLMTLRARVGGAS